MFIQIYLLAAQAAHHDTLHVDTEGATWAQLQHVLCIQSATRHRHVAVLYVMLIAGSLHELCLTKITFFSQGSESVGRSEKGKCFGTALRWIFLKELPLPSSKITLSS